MSEMKQVEVLIIGAGPAGSVCGSLLKQAGVECLIVDQATFPRDKVCGGGLTVKAWRLLDMLLPGIQYNYRPITRMRCQFENDAVCEFQAEYPIRMTRRKDFDYSLLQYYLDHGGELMKGSFARFDQQADGQVLVTLKSGEQISCRYLVAADGSNSQIRQQIHGDSKLRAMFLEQFDEGKESDDVFVHFSNNYRPGVFYKFSSVGRDMYGYASVETNDDMPRHKAGFKQALTKFGVPVDRICGAYIQLDTVPHTADNVILIGDAGGFANKLTGEGLYDAFKTAANAKCAIVEGRSFSETNKEEFRKMGHQKKVYEFFFSPIGWRLLRWALRYPRIIKWLFDAKMKRETFRA
jgi:flavin-dependent dehydrogenase